MDRNRTLAVLVVGLLVLLVSSLVQAGLTPVTPSGEPDGIQFREVSEPAGVSYTTTGSNLGIGDGAVLVTDFDRDGWEDLLLLGGAEPGLYRNTERGGFERSAALPPIEEDRLQSGLFFDYDNDGWEDLLLLPRHGSAIFLENQEGTFQHADVGLNVPLTWGTSAAAADYDGDGCLDLFITQNGDWSERLPNRSTDNPIDPDNGEPNLLFDGDCSSFDPVTDAGIDGTRWSLAASFVDLTGDGRPDIHVANDFNFDRLYINQGDGTFVDQRIPSTNRHGMTSEVEDVNGDGLLDVFVTNIEFRNPGEIWMMRNGLGMVNRGNNLLVNEGGGRFVDRASEYGVKRGGWGWSGVLVDLDNDGDLDLLHATQDYLEATDDNWRDVSTPPALWERSGEGFTRLNASAHGMVPANGRGLVNLDFDRDGDQDIVVADTTDSFIVYENVGSRGHWLQVDVHVDSGIATGTKVKVIAGEQTQVQVRDSKVNFFSQSSRVLHFGLNEVEQVTIQVTFPDGTVRIVEEVPVDQRVIVSKNGTVRTVSP